jgi:hypothetical protein
MIGRINDITCVAVAKSLLINQQMNKIAMQRIPRNGSTRHATSCWLCPPPEVLGLYLGVLGLLGTNGEDTGTGMSRGCVTRPDLLVGPACRHRRGMRSKVEGDASSAAGR